VDCAPVHCPRTLQEPGDSRMNQVKVLLSTAGEVSAFGVCRAERGGMSTQTVYLSHKKNERVVLLSYDEAKNDHSSLQAMEDEIASFKRFDCYEEVSSDMVSANANIISTR
jgi:hypothetical protein